MDFELSDEQRFLQDAAKDALGRVKTVEAARDALEGGSLPDLWPTATTAGWTGLLVAINRALYRSADARSPLSCQERMADSPSST